ncbi:hypothetical protein Bpfe_006922, partial [Biomphalaria pfeifferi]
LEPSHVICPLAKPYYLQLDNSHNPARHNRPATGLGSFLQPNDVVSHSSQPYVSIQH